MPPDFTLLSRCAAGRHGPGTYASEREARQGNGRSTSTAVFATVNACNRTPERRLPISRHKRGPRWPLLSWRVDVEAAHDEATA
jgi:hypothetical protein